MIKILHVVSSLNINAGMMSVVMNYYRNIDRNEIQFDFWYFEEMKETHQAEITQLGGKTFFMPYRSFKPSDQNEIRAFFQEHKGEYAAVHCHPIWSSTIIASEAKRSGIKHIIQHSHSTRFSDKKSSEIRNRLLMKFIKFFATDFIACSPEAGHLFGRRIERTGKIYYLLNAIDIDQYTFDPNQRIRIREEFGADDKTLLVGNVGRLCVQKNQSFMLDVFHELHYKHPNTKMIIVGDGELRANLQEKIEELGISDNVIMTGKRRDIKAILSGLDLFLMPSLFEGAPVSAIEALTNGLPCVLSDTITKSINMTGVKYVNLSIPASEWANSCLSFMAEQEGRDRYDYSEVVSRGFDIKTEAKKLQEYYLRLR